MQNYTIPKDYRPLLNVLETERAIGLIKEFFQTNLAFELNLTRTTAPLFVLANTGINDNLNGIEKPVYFQSKFLNDEKIEIVQSLAKWKRLALAELNIQPNCGIYTDMNAIRPDEELDNLHSLYVDQWDWERVITPEQRNVTFLKNIVEKIYDVMRRTEKYVCYHYSALDPVLPEKISFVHSEELEERYPDLSPKEREKQACTEMGAVFVIGIGAALKDGQPHDGRAPDYDDWSTVNEQERKGLNGDILIYYPLLDCVFELSSMGIRVNAESLNVQLKQRQALDRQKLYFHKKLLNGELPECIGGGIGQSRLCMLYLRKAHIGEIQSSIWGENIISECLGNNIHLL